MAPLISYRLWFIKSIAEIFLPPIAISWAVKRVVEWLEIHHLTGARSVLFYGLSVPAIIIARRRFSAWRAERLSKTTGAKLIPKFEGKKIGNTDLLQRLVAGTKEGYVGEVFDEFLDEAGSDTIRVSFLWTERILTRDPEVLKGVLTTQFNSFGKGTVGQLRAGPFFGSGIFAVDGDLWKMHRSLARPYFARDRISDYESFQKYSAKLLSVLRSCAERGVACDVQDLFARFTLDTAGEFLFGSSDLNTLDMPLPLPGKAKMGTKGSAAEGDYGGFAQAFEDAQITVSKRGASTPFAWILAEFFKDEQEEPMKVVNRWIQPLVKRAIQMKDRAVGRSEDTNERSFLEHLAIEVDDEDLMRDQLVNMLVAARDTTAALLTFAVYLLSTHPEVMEKLRAEILGKIGFSEAPTYEQMTQLKYLRAVLNETLRLFPPVAINGRSSLEDGAIIPLRGQQPYLVPTGGTQITWSTISFQRRKDLWGDDADLFDPERWIDERRQKIVQNPFMFTPFHAGPRICIGQQFAYNEASFVMIRLLQTFDSFKLVQESAAPVGSVPPEDWKQSKGRKGVEKVWPKTAVTMYVRGGLWMEMSLS